MLCKQCNRELRIAPEQVGSDSNGIPIYHRFGYCDNCMLKVDLDETAYSKVAVSNEKQGNAKKKQSALSVLAAILALFTCTCFIGAILGIIDIAKQDKSTKHTGSWFAIIFTSIILVFGIATNNSTTEDEKSAGTKASTEISTTVESGEIAGTKVENNSTEESDVVTEGESFVARDLKITVNEIQPDYTEYDNEYGLHDLEEGFKYIKVSFTYENVGDSDSYVSIYDYDCYADGTLCEQYFYFGGDFMNVNLSADRNVSFETYYIVPSAAEEIELEYTSNVWTDEKVIVKVK